MPKCFFVSDLHGVPEKYSRLFQAIEDGQPEAVFFGGDLLPHAMSAHSGINPGHRDFINDFLVPKLLHLREKAPKFYPRIFLILGNDDPRFEEAAILDAAAKEVWEYVSERKVSFGRYEVFGYPFSPHPHFSLKIGSDTMCQGLSTPVACLPKKGCARRPFQTIRRSSRPFARIWPNW